MYTKYRQNGPHHFMLEELSDNSTRIIHLSKKVSITVNASLEDISQSWYHWQNGAFIQNAFPFLNADEREFLMTGITITEWNEMYPSDSKKEN